MNDNQRPASEAEAEAEGHRPKAAAHEAEADVTVLAANPKAAAILAKAARARIETEAAIAAQDAKAIREAKAKEAALAAQLAKAEAKAANKAKAKATRRAARTRLAQKAGALLDRIRSEAAASYSAFVYLVVVSVAVWSQREVFHESFLWNDFMALGAAIFIEGTGLAFYATSVSMRLDGRSGLIPRLIAWAVTGFAAFMQYMAHKDVLVSGVPLLSYALAAASIAALLLAEIRTSHKVGRALEALDQKDRPQARLGLRFCLRYPGQAWWAISAMIAIPSIRTRTQALRAGRLIQTLRARRDLHLALMAEAEAQVRAARKAGASEAVLMRLEEWAHFGLEAIGLQAQLASAPASTPEETDRPIKAEAEVRPPAHERPKAEGPRRKGLASPRPKAITPKAEAEAEADEGRPDAQWADRPGNNAFVWEQRLAELAAQFPGTADQVPSRQVCIDTLRARKEEGTQLRFAWTNKGHVGFLLNDLKALRSAGYPDPKVTTDADSPNTL